MLFNTAWKGITWLLSLRLPLVASKSMCFLPQRSITHDIQPQYFQNYWSEKEQGIQNASEDFTQSDEYIPLSLLWQLSRRTSVPFVSVWLMFIQR